MSEERTANTQLLGDLDQWARERRIYPKSFDCPHYEKCNGSLSEGSHLDGGYTCTMSYVGQEYGAPELAPGKAFRLVIVGIDSGANYEAKKLEGFVECQQGIEDWYYEKSFDKSHPHYLGVIRTAAAILGRDGKYCLDHCHEDSKCFGNNRPNGERCVLRSFAQPNLVKCANGPNRKTRSRNVMFNNCSEHFLSELEILKPNLIVFHGGDARWAFPQALQKRGFDSVPLADSPKQGDFSVVHELTGASLGSKCFILYLSHPSYGWLNRQWEPVVEPALKLLRSMSAIPPL